VDEQVGVGAWDALGHDRQRGLDEAGARAPIVKLIEGEAAVQLGYFPRDLAFVRGEAGRFLFDHPMHILSIIIFLSIEV
jgi:hypothetical protein